MEEISKIFTKLSWLWFLLGILFIISAIFTGGSFIRNLAIGDSGPITGLYEPCLIYLIIITVVLLLFGGLSFKKWRLLAKGKKSAIKDGFFLAFIFLLILGGVNAYVFWFLIVYTSFSSSLWDFVIIVPILLLIIDIIILVESSRRQVKELLRKPPMSK